MKQIIILGSTGSIGTNTLDIVSKCRDGFQVIGLTAGSNDEKLEDQLRMFKPKAVALSDRAAAERLRARCRDVNVDIMMVRKVWPGWPSYQAISWFRRSSVAPVSYLRSPRYARGNTSRWRTKSLW